MVGDIFDAFEKKKEIEHGSAEKHMLLDSV